MMLTEGEVNEDVEGFWFGSRYFVSEPVIVPKKGGNPENEEEAYLLGMVKDAVKARNFLAIFDLERDLREGPVCKIWLKSGVPHGVHGCFAEDGEGGPSVFC
jgi:carotenoid cleavage dioxygenase-like enzyme